MSPSLILWGDLEQKSHLGVVYMLSCFSHVELFLPDPGIELTFLMSPALEGDVDSLPIAPPGKPPYILDNFAFCMPDNF